MLGASGLGSLRWPLISRTLCVTLHATIITLAQSSTCNGTLLTIKVGLFNDWLVSYAANNIISAAFVDADFRSTHTPIPGWTSFFFRNNYSVNPCLRIRPIFLHARTTIPNDDFRTQVESIQDFGNDTIDALIYFETHPPQELAKHSTVSNIPSMSVFDSPRIQREINKYPFLFRYPSANAVDIITSEFEYYKYFGWRLVHYLYTGSLEKTEIKFQYFQDYWGQDNLPPNRLQVWNFPTGTKYQVGIIQTMLNQIKFGAGRFLLIELFHDQTFPLLGDANCPLFFSACVVRDLMIAGIWAPTYQFLTNADLVEGTNYFNNTWTYAMHYACPTWYFSPHVYQRLVALMTASAMRQSMYMNFTYFYQEYAIGRWREPALSIWNNYISQNPVLTPPPPNPNNYTLFSKFFFGASGIEVLYRAWICDIMMYMYNAYNVVMNTHHPTSKSQITPQMVATALNSSVPPFTIFGGDFPFALNPNQVASYQIRVFQRTHPTITSSAEFMCCQEKLVNANGDVTNRAEPRWATGEKSNTPPASLLNCTAGQYLSDGICKWCQEGRFSNTTDATACELCDRGKYSKAKATSCDFCEKGKVASELQMAKCDSCNSGTYAGAFGMSLCVFCEFGRFSDAVKATACFECGGDLTTHTTGSTEAKKCVCPAGKFSENFQMPTVNFTSNTKCNPCMKGLDCESSWPDSWNAKGSHISECQPGFFTLSTAPFSVYKCCPDPDCDEDCPGGVPESCAGGRGGLICNKCNRDGYFISGSGCKECPPYLKLMVIICIAASTALCVAAYYAANGTLTVNADNPLAFFLFVGLVVTSFQVIGVVRGLNIPWPTTLGKFMSGSSSAFALDYNSVSIECAVGTDTTVIYLCQVLTPHILLLEVWLCVVVSRLLAAAMGNPEKAWENDKALNVVGQVMQALFIAFCVISVKPLQCFIHPNDKKSVRSLPRILCYEGGEHTTLLILAACIVVSFLLPFVAWCIYGCVMAPHESSGGNLSFLRRYRFLLYRFRPDCWWWGLAFLLRQTLLAFATVVPADTPHAQIFYTGGTLAVYGVFAARYWPWICDELSIIDVGSMLILVLMMFAAGQFLEEPQPNKGRVEILIVLFLLFGGLLLRYMLIVLTSVCAKGVFGEFGTDKPDRMTVCELWLRWLDYSKSLNNKDVVEIVCRMNSFDRKNLFNLISSWNAVTSSQTSNRKSVEGNKWRLKGLPSRAKISQGRCEEVARGIRGLNNDFDDSPLNVQGDCEHNVVFPRSFRVLASAGAALTLNDKPGGFSGFHHEGFPLK